MASKYIFTAITFVSLIINLNILDAQQINQTEIERGSDDVLSQPSLRPDYLKSQAQSNEPLLVILVYFPETDKNVFAKTDQAHWSNKFFNNKPGIKDYFISVSYGKLNLVPASEKSSPENNGVVGWYCLNNSFAHYKNSSSHSAPYFKYIAKDAIIASAKDVKYSSFDINADGYISSNELHIYVIVACYEERYQEQTIPPEPKLRRCHFYLVESGLNSDLILALDGKQIGFKDYNGGICLSAELLREYKRLENIPTRVGFLAHEIGHDLVPTLPEHYCDPETDPANAGIWCLMGKGDIYVDADYPTHICAYHKWLLGWVQAETIKIDMTCNIPQIETNNKCLMLWENGNPSSEFFIVENRQKQAPRVYDCNLPGSGLLIWHVDQKQINDLKNKGVVLERADNDIGADRLGDSGDPFVYGRAFFEDSSNPDSRKNGPDNDITGVAVYNISVPEAMMTANVKVSHVPNQILCTCVPNSIPANGISTVTISAYLLDTWIDTVESATNLITFSITAGAGSGQIVSPNPVAAVNGVATISLKSTTTPGTVTIEATAPNLTKGSTSVYVYSTYNPTEVGGEIKTNTTWTLTKSPYLVISDIQVHSNATLTIEPGVVVLFNSGTGLRIAGDDYWNDKGALKAQGTATNPILFSSSSGNIGDWKGILFDEASDQDVSSIMTYCIVEKAGQVNARGYNANISCRRTTTPALSNCTIQNSSGYGIYLDISSPIISNNTIVNNNELEIIYLNGSTATINGNAITGNGSSYWLFCATNTTNPVILNNTFNGNVKKSLKLGTNSQLNGNSLCGAIDPAIEIWGGDLNTTKTWSKQTGVSIYKIINSDLHVHNNGSLTIAPGISVLFNSGTGLRIAGDDYWEDRGSLSAEGTASNPILFSSASGNVGDWKGILFDEASDNNVNSSMHYCIVEKAGQANARANNANISCRRTNAPAISNCTIRNSSGYGFYLDTSSPTISNNIITNASNSEVLYLNGSTSTINNNTITGNGSSYWLYCATNTTNPTIINNVFTGTATKAMRLGTNFQLSGNSLSEASDLTIEVWGGELNTLRTWSVQTGTSTYKVVSSDLHVHSNGSLTINPGTVVLFNSGTGLRIAGDDYWDDRGALSAQGTSMKTIIFSSASGKVGDWKGILFDEASDKNVSSILSHCIVENAGQTNARSFNSGIHCKNTNSPVINNTIIKGNGSVGFSCDNASPLITSSKVINNLSYGIYCTNSSHPTIGNTPGATNDIYGNGTYDIYVTGADNINARYNYWGTTNEAQIKARIYDKYDNPNSGEVFYAPCATESGGANQAPTAFSLYSPLNNSIVKTLTPTLTWQKSEDIDGSIKPVYTLQIGINSNFVQDFYEFYNITDATYTLSQPLINKTKYFWRVKANDKKNASTWSNEVWCFIIDLSAQNHPPTMPTALIPINGEEAHPEDYLVWAKSTDPDVGDGITYILELDNNANFSSPEIHQSGILEDRMSNKMIVNIFTNNWIDATNNAVYIQISRLLNFNNLIDDSTYYWRVKAMDQYGVESNFTSGTSRFFFNKANTVPQPVNAGFSPKDGIEVRTNTPELSWYPAKDADLSDHVGTLRYKLQLDDDGEFTKNYRFQHTTGFGLNTIEMPDPLNENMKWYYRIQAMDDEGLLSAWSVIQNFWVNSIDEPPADFTICEPANNSTVIVDSIIFRWRNTKDVDPNDKISFTLEYSLDASFSSNTMTVSNLTDSAIVIDAKNLSKSTYYWRIKASDNDGLITWGSNSSENPWSFHLTATNVANMTSEIPDVFSLSQNYPNPFNPETIIKFQLPKSCPVFLKIYNPLGQEIRTLINTDQNAGYHEKKWDGKNDFGQLVSPGIYLFQLKAGDFCAVKKMIFLR